MASTTGWTSSTNAGAIGNNQGLNNSSGFNAFPEGFVRSDFSFYKERDNACFWSTSTSYDYPGTARNRELDYDVRAITNGLFDKRYGLALRFVSD